MELRPYQKECLEKVLWTVQNKLPGNSVCVLPTGAGKSVLIASVIHQIDEPILIIQPSKEILEQNYAKLLMYVEEGEVGVYSASMNEKTINRFTFATIQSIYKKPDLFQRFKLVIVDECHLVNPANLTGMFTTFLKAIGNPPVIGLTATPYRMCTGYTNLGQNIYGGTDYESFATIKLINRMKGMFWKRVLYNINASDLIAQGYLCGLEYVDKSVVTHNDIPLNKSRTDFDMDSLETVMDTKKEEIKKAIQYAQENCKSVLVFCSSVRQAEHLSADTPGSSVISAKTTKKDREKIIQDFKNGTTKTVFNMGVLTTGFDHPALDCIVLLRPTRSIALYYQMLGRGVRLAPGKTSCKVIDLTSTVQNMGRVETIKLVKREKWELESETGSWHNAELYRFQFSKGGETPSNTIVKKDSGNLLNALNAVRNKNF